MDIKEIIRSAGMSDRPDFYSGRGATLSDLDSGKLEKIWQGIRDHHGIDAAVAFTDMVEDMKEMNATDFLNNCFMLARSGYKWTKGSAIKTGIDIDKDEEGRHSVAQAFGTIVSVMFHSGRDDSYQIKSGFLLSKGRKISGPNLHFL